MKEIIEIKRKEFEVLEKLGEHSYKVKRKDKIYFLKKYDNKDSFNQFVEQYRRLKITAMDIPKCYLFDKNLLISVVDFIEGDNIFEILLKEEIKNEEIYKNLFLAEWYMRREKLRIDFHPDNFIFNGKKLYYLPYKFGKFEPNYDFNMNDLRLWFITKQFAQYAKSKGIDFDDSRVGNEYATNKQIALMAVKYYM
ncbi:MAG: hypothetical protein J5511_03655 [Bacilli bacterium]|nr:hypothetical protein [Bacilli bacterium]